MSRISIIIATYNRCQSLEGTLKTLWPQAAGIPEVEILVVDNNSTDATKAVAKKWMPQFQGRLRYVFEPRQGKSFALNTAVRAARGEIVAFLDDDVFVEAGWLAAMDATFRTTGCDGVGGRVLPEYPPDAPRWVRDNMMLLSGPIVAYDYGTGTLPYARPMYEFIGANFAFRKRVLEDCGLFNEAIGVGRGIENEDKELCGRLIRAGKSLVYCGQALVRHPVDPQRMSLIYIAKWNIRLGRHRFAFDEKGQLEKGLVCYFGVPRYLIKEILLSVFKAGAGIFNKRLFLAHWMRLFIDIGRAQEIRKTCSLMEKKRRNREKSR